MCLQPQYRIAIAAALPRLKQLDGQPVSPGEALQYLAAMQLQAFQPARPASAAASVLHARQQRQGQGQQAGEQGDHEPAGAAACSSRAAGPGWQQADEAPAEAGGAEGPAGEAPLQRIQQVLASFAGRAGHNRLPQPEAQGASEQSHCSNGGASPEQELHKLLQSLPQLADVLSKTLAQVQAEGKPVKQNQQPPAQGPQGCTVQRTSSAAQTESAEAGSSHHAATASVQSGKEEELQLHVASLQDEIVALQAELEVQGQAAQRAQQEAAASLSQAQRQVAEAHRAAEASIEQARQAAAAALEQTKHELCCLQVRCSLLEGSKAGAC